MKKDLTIILTFYNQHDIIKEQIKMWENYPQEVKDNVDFIIIDDCSINPIRYDDNKIDLKIYRVLEDKYCNIGGARNLGSHVCETEWMIHSDVDHFIESDLASELVSLVSKNQKNNIYKFNRINILDKKTKIHPGTMLLTKDLYWDIGGSDEDFVGNYGQTDVHFFYRSNGKCNTIIRDDLYLKYNPKGETNNINRKNLKPNQDIFNNKKITNNWSKDFLRFKWKKII